MRKRNPDVCFITASGHDVRLKWENNEYRAYMDKHNGHEFEYMKLGSCNPEPLKKYILERRQNG